MLLILKVILWESLKKQPLYGMFFLMSMVIAIGKQDIH